VPCALIINELITNAYKYAFEGQENGVIDIKFHKEASGHYKLSVADNGVGLPEGFTLSDSSQHSLGLSLVKTLTQQLKGELELNNDNGGQFVITFPAERVDKP
jgi:two-component sensor histidine kinase